MKKQLLDQSDFTRNASKSICQDCDLPVRVAMGCMVHTPVRNASKSICQDRDPPVRVAMGCMVHTPVIVFGVDGSEPAHM